MSASRSEYIIDYPLLTKLCFSSIIFIADSVSTPSALGTARVNEKPGRKYTCALVSLFVILESEAPREICVLCIYELSK